MAIVEGVYRLLGVIAPVNQRLGRIRVNFIPANIALILSVGALAAISWNSVGKVLASRRTPEPQTVDVLISKTRFAQGYVAVQGKLMADSRLTFGEPGGVGNLQLADYTWAPLVDGENGTAIMAQFPAAHDFPGNASDVTVEGILRPLNSVVSRQLKEHKYVHAGIPIDRRFMLVVGRRPGSLQGPIITGTVFGVFALALAWCTFKRNAIFMPADGTSSGSAAALLESASTEPLLVSGTMALNEKKRRFFTNMPAIMQRVQTGDMALLSNITTSSSYFGIKTDEHTGVWMIVMRAGSITEAQSGYVFWGMKKMRATQFRYVNAMTGASERAVVASPAALAAGSTQPF